MRALLVVNPTATTTTAKGRDVLTRALASDLDVRVVETQNRGHAAALACHAARDGFDLVVAQGGDGTVNEVVNGLLTDGPAPDLPALAVVPGGSTNVFARTLGIPNDPIEATGEILDALRTGRSRRIGLGRVDDRWFTFTAGFGFDAEVVRRIERRRRSGRGITQARYVRAAVTHFLVGTDRHHPAVTLERPDAEPCDGIFFAIVSNTSPWTYLGARPLRPTPEASFDTALDVFAPRRMGILRTLGYLGQALREKPRLRGRRLLRLHDVAEFTLTADRPLALQVDGDHLGERSQVRFTAVPEVLRVLT
ncbi:MAG TPA: diacylglycerol kinase family protein [Mycobacteriales bacterium]|nr:diacylglycerol kinase family protein [Mycobacteriales bacterium]